MAAIILLACVAWVLVMLAITVALCWLLDKIIEKMFNL